MNKAPLKVVVTRKLPQVVENRMEELFNVLLRQTDSPMTNSELIKTVKEADILVPTLGDKIDSKIFSQSGSKLKLVANYGAGFDHIDVKVAMQNNVIVSNTPDVLTDDTADVTMALILGVPRRLAEGVQIMATGNWKGWSPTALMGNRIAGKNLGILGMGRIGQAVAIRAKSFGLKIHYHNRRQLRSEIEEIKALLKEKADLTYVDTQVSHVQADLVQRMAKMRMAIHEDLKSCATIEQVTAMLQEKEHQILEFVGEIVKKVPRPIRIEVKKKYLGTRKRVKLTFKCPRSGTELVVKSTSWSLWLKFAVALLQTGESILQADIGGAVEGGVATLQAAYNAYHESQADHESFDALMHAPLLLSSEQDELIVGLRKGGFFDKFSYNEQMGQWEFGHAARAPSALAPAPPPNMPPNPPVAPVAAGVDEL